MKMNEERNIMLMCERNGRQETRYVILKGKDVLPYKRPEKDMH